MLVWMRSFGELQRVGVESTGSYGAGLLRFMQQAFEVAQASIATMQGGKSAKNDSSCPRESFLRNTTWPSARAP
jgi:transposase